jgi:Uma2 family endonuclease
MEQVLEPYRWSREQYDRLAECGALEGLRVELLEGLIVENDVQSPEHMSLIQALTGLLGPATADDRLRVQGPLAATDDSEPEPDLALLASWTPGPHPRTAVLAIEVAWTDRRTPRRKIAIYAVAGVEHYWIVDGPARTVEVFTDPRPDGYGRIDVLRGDDVLEVPTLDARTTVAELFARAGLH